VCRFCIGDTAQKELHTRGPTLSLTLVHREDEGILKDVVIESYSTSFFVLAEGSRVVTQKHGKVEMSFCCGCHSLLLSKVLCTPYILINLLLIGNSTAFELDFGFSGEHCFVSVGDTVLDVAVRLDNNLYLLDMQVTISGVAAQNRNTNYDLPSLVMRSINYGYRVPRSCTLCEVTFGKVDRCHCQHALISAKLILFHASRVQHKQISEYLLIRNCMVVESLHQFFNYQSKYLNSVKC
jgi:hypothetical protein